MEKWRKNKRRKKIDILKKKRAGSGRVQGTIWDKLLQKDPKHFKV